MDIKSNSSGNVLFENYKMPSRRVFWRNLSVNTLWSKFNSSDVTVNFILFLRHVTAQLSDLTS